MKSYLHIYQVLLFLYLLSEEIAALFGDRRPRGGLLIHVDDADYDGLARQPPSHVTFEFHHTRPIIEDNFYYDLSKVNKKRPKFGKLKTALLEEGHEEVELHHLHGLGQLFRQVSLPPVEDYAGYGSSHGDVKPVTEVIEDDIKYDFRTKTHSIR